jgi:hypothetical protein
VSLTAPTGRAFEQGGQAPGARDHPVTTAQLARPHKTDDGRTPGGALTPSLRDGANDGLQVLKRWNGYGHGCLLQILTLRMETACLCDSAGDVITVTRCNGGDDMDAASGTLRELDHPGTGLPRQTPRSQAQPISRRASNFIASRCVSAASANA